MFEFTVQQVQPNMEVNIPFSEMISPPGPMDDAIPFYVISELAHS